MSILSSLPAISLTLIALGLGAGIVSALLGVGSGVVLVPTMVIVMGLSQKSAQGTALAVMVPMAMVGAARYMANPKIDISLLRVGLISIGAIIGALIGAAIVSRIPAIVLRRLFAGFLLIVAVRMMIGTKRKPTTEAPVTTAPAAGAPSESQVTQDE